MYKTQHILGEVFYFISSGLCLFRFISVFVIYILSLMLMLTINENVASYIVYTFYIICPFLIIATSYLKYRKTDLFVIHIVFTFFTNLNFFIDG